MRQVRRLRAPLDAERDRGIFGPTTERTVTLFQQELGLAPGQAPNGVVDEATARGLNALVAGLDDGREVSGTVRFESGMPAAGLTIAAVDRDLRDEQSLNSTQTQDDGSYLLEYSAHDAAAREAGSADLVVRAFDSNGALLAASPILFNAPAQAEIDLTITTAELAPPSLFARIQAALEPLRGDIAVEELDETDEHDDLSFLAGETGSEKRAVARFALAHRLAQAQDPPPEFWFALLGDTSIPVGEGPSLADDAAQVWSRLGGLDSLSLRRSLESAIAVGDIDEARTKLLPKWIDAFATQAAGRMLEVPMAGSFVKPALERAGIDGADAQERFAQLVRQHGSLTPELATDLEKDPAFGPEKVADLTASFELGRLVRSDFPVVALLRTSSGSNARIRSRCLREWTRSDGRSWWKRSTLTVWTCR